MAIVDKKVFIVEDDPSVRDSLGLLLGLEDYSVALFADGESLLKAYQPTWTGCLLIDIRMPGISGLELQKRLIALRCPMPVIVITGHGDVGSAREAFRAQAIDFLEKPIDKDKLMAALDDAFIRMDSVRKLTHQQVKLQATLVALTPREKEVMDLVVAGKHNREISEQLGISVRTLEVHKARMMNKLRVDSIPQLVRLSLGVSD